MKPHALDQLLQHPGLWRAADRQSPGQATGTSGLSTGFATLDRELPDGGWPCHDLMEVLCCQWGSGELPLLQPALATLSQQPRWLVLVAPPWLPYAPGLQRAGIQLNRLLVLETRAQRDTLWAMEECLQSGCCSAVLGWPGTLTPTAIRRLQRAAQQGECWGVLLRPQAHKQQPSPAPLRVEIAPALHALQVRIMKCRGRWGSDWLTCTTHADTDTTPAAPDWLKPANGASQTPVSLPVTRRKGQPPALDLPVLPDVHTGQAPRESW